MLKVLFKKNEETKSAFRVQSLLFRIEVDLDIAVDIEIRNVVVDTLDRDHETLDLGSLDNHKEVRKDHRDPDGKWDILQSADVGADIIHRLDVEADIIHRVYVLCMDRDSRSEDVGDNGLEIFVY